MSGEKNDNGKTRRERADQKKRKRIRKLMMSIKKTKKRVREKAN